MHALIDRARLVIVAKHENVEVLSNLAHLKMLSASITPCDHVDFLTGFTDYELMLLYRNLTGEEPSYYRNQLVSVIIEAVSRMPEFQCNAAELQRQADYVTMDDCENVFDYAPGSHRPVIAADVFLAPRVTRSCEEVKYATMNLRKTIETIYPDSFEKNREAVKALQTEIDPGSIATSGPKGTAPRRGTGRELIWGVADEMWQKQGKPLNVKDILSLRREIMVELESNHSVKRSTSSVELGRWQAELLSNNS